MMLRLLSTGRYAAILRNVSFRIAAGIVLVAALAVSVRCQSPSAPVVVLQPSPREVKFGGTISIANGIVVEVPGNDAEDQFAANDLREAIYAAGLPAHTSPYIVRVLRMNTPAGHRFIVEEHISLTPEMYDEGYAIHVGAKGAEVVAQSASGIFYGMQTLKQMLPLAAEAQVLPAGTVRDWPAMKYRGIQDDLSRGPFPTVDFIKHQLRVFASFKVNVYSPYFEHTLAYAATPLSAPPGSSLSPADIAELVRYANSYHITIIPEQESFGHLHNVLKYDIYSELGETPHGHVLAPGQAGTLPLIHSWFEQIAAEFPSPFVHIGADETFELGQGQTRQAMQAKGLGKVYMEFLTRIHDDLAPLHKRILFWGDIAVSNPAEVATLPKDLIAVSWNYWDSSGFDAQLAPFRKQGIETWVAPGDSNWNQVYPDNNVGFRNIQGFIRDGQSGGSTGALTTVWNDDGEGLFAEDWYGVLFGAVAAWQPGESSISDWQSAYGRLFHGDTSDRLNQAQRELMAAHLLLTKADTGRNSDSVFWSDPFSPSGRTIHAKLLPYARDLRLHAERAIILIAEARAAQPNLRERGAIEAMELGARRLDLIGLKAEYADEIAALYSQLYSIQHDPAQRAINRERESRNKANSITGMNGKMQDLRNAYSSAHDQYRQVWLAENSPYWINNVLVRYDLATQLWEQRGEQFDELFRLLGGDQELPAPETLGLPLPQRTL